jgi:hypothetical protein
VHSPFTYDTRPYGLYDSYGVSSEKFSSSRLKILYADVLGFCWSTLDEPWAINPLVLGKTHDSEPIWSMYYNNKQLIVFCKDGLIHTQETFNILNDAWKIKFVNIFCLMWYLLAI